MNLITQDSPQEKKVSQLYFKLIRVFEGLSAQPCLRSTTENSVHLQLCLKHKKKMDVKIQTLWSFIQDKQVKIKVELLNKDQAFLQPNRSISVNDLVSQLNRQSILGRYFMDPSNSSILRFNSIVFVKGSYSFLCSDLSEIYSQVSEQFTKFVCKMQLIPCAFDNNDLKSEKLVARLRKLRYLKQFVQKRRYHREKATTCFDLTQYYVKIIGEAIKFKNTQYGGVISYFLNKQFKPTQAKLRDCNILFEDITKIIEKQIKKENEKKNPEQIVKGISINKVLSEEKIGEGSYGEIYKGKYVVQTSPTVNPNIEIKKGGKETKVLAKKTFKSHLGEKDKAASKQNELKFLNYIRSKKNHRFSGYYFPRNKEGQNIQNKNIDHIFINYYPATLKQVCSSMTDIQILKVCQQILEGICFLNDESILHRDIKETNILIDKEYNVKFIDFGSVCGVFQKKVELGSFQAYDNLLMYTQGYCLLYDAAKTEFPLIGTQYTKDEYYRWETFDIYSFGTILNNLFGLTQQIPDHLLYRQLIYLARKCHEINPADRITARQAQVYLYQITQLYQTCCQLQEKEIIKEQTQTNLEHSH